MRWSIPVNSYFSSDATWWEKLAYAIITVILATAITIACLAPILDLPCNLQPRTTEYANHDYEIDACVLVRHTKLGFMNRRECDHIRRILWSMICGTIIGWERRRADRAAGIRTMAMVCLGSCVFTIDSMFAFLSGPMSWDASRVAAAVPSGVGFLGAASIWKGTSADGTGRPEVHGLTTATSVWLAAAVGILNGGALHVPAIFATIASVVYLRFAPRHSESGGPDYGSGLSSLNEPLRIPSRRPSYSGSRSRPSIHM